MKRLSALLVFASLFGLTYPVQADTALDSKNEFWTSGVHCPEITDSALRFGMKDSRGNRRISDFQTFLADYYGLEKSAIVTGRFDNTTRNYVLQLHAEAGLKQNFVDAETRAIVNPRCGDAGIRPRIVAFTASEGKIKKGESVLLSLDVQNANSCKIINLTAAREQGDGWEGAEGNIAFEDRNAESASMSLRVQPLKTSVYEVFCDYHYPDVQDGTTQSMKSLIVTVR
ncbi:MAG TPA: hypothetical protein VGB97_03190 [Candidatus Paceibacterota bacterium]|jgi:hypothetical protein